MDAAGVCDAAFDRGDDWSGRGRPFGKNARNMKKPLNFPAEFQARYQTNSGTADDFTNHGDGVVMVVEDQTADLDGDGKRGLDFNGDGQADLFRVRLYVKKTTPSTK